MELQSVAEKALNVAKKSGSGKTMVNVSLTKSKEFNIEANQLTLLRTTFDQGLKLKTWIDGKQSAIEGNQFSDESVSDLAKSVVEAALSTPADEANGFADSQGEKHFHLGSDQADEEGMHATLSNLLKENREHFPKILLEASTIKFVHQQKACLTSEGTWLTSQQNSYQGFIFFAARDGKKTSSFNYGSFVLPSGPIATDQSLLKIGHLGELFRQSSEQTEVKKLPEKFEGDVIFSPHCLGDMMEMGGWIDFLRSSFLLRGSSFFNDQIGKSVASVKWTMNSKPADSHFPLRNYWTADGYLTKNETLFENGVLKNYLLDHYAAKKMGQNVSRSGGEFLELQAGSVSLQEMIGSVKKGVLMCRYSSGKPGENGDISGVAKNSYYIENGRIQFPLGETMVSGNLKKMLHQVQEISSEAVDNGLWKMPWVQFSGMTVS